VAQESLALPRQQIISVDTMSTARKSFIILSGVIVGLLVAMLWSAQLVDDQIGENVANGLLGYNAKSQAIGSGVAGAVFAFVAGLAGTFTACNVAAFSAVGPMMGRGATAGDRVRRALPQIGWLAVGVAVVSALWGAIGAAIGTGVPQLNTHTIGNGMPIRVVQSAIVFTVIGVVFLWMGLAAIDVVPDPLGRLTARWPQTPLLVMGGLVGAFLVGRPYPLFFKLFAYAAERHNPLYGALTFLLTALGNIVVLGVLFLLVSAIAGEGYQRWLTARPGRIATITATALVIGGAFLIFYWGVRLPARFDYGWFPRMPWS
jgi:hypothetical protein